jgi:uncharacterized UPF0146 family protein
MKVNVKFQSNPDINKAKLVKSLYRAIFLHIKLPEEITIEFSSLKDNIYAETPVNHLANYTIKLSENLSLEQIIEPLIHELVHINQIYEKRLSVTRGGNIIWEGKRFIIKDNNMTFKEYRNLPWELEAFYKQKELLGKIL